jgi:serine/threonine-protein kinase
MPFKGETTLELIKAKEDGKFEPIRKHNLDVPERLDLIVAKMIQKKPDLRYQSCAECAAALEELGLTSETLSFIEGATGQVPSAGAAKTKAPVAKGGMTAAPKKAVTAPPSETPTPDQDVWFIRYKDTDGEYVHRRMKTHQVHELIKENKLDNKTEASRQAKEGYRPLATYREFTQALQARGLQAKADRRTEKVKSFMDNIDAEDRRYKRWKWVRRMFSSVGGFLTLILMLAVVGGVIAAAVYFGWEYVQAFAKQLGLV